MTPELSEILKTLAPILIALIGGGSAFALQYINIRKENIKREQAVELYKKELDTERQKLENARVDQENKNQDFIRSVALDFQKQVQEVKTECETELEAMQRQIDRHKDNVDAKVLEIGGLKLQVEGVSSQLKIQTEQNADLLAANAELLTHNETLQTQLTERTGERDHEREKNGKLEGKIQTMQEEMKSLTDRLADAEKRLQGLEAKPDTGKLDSTKVPDTDPAPPKPTAEA